MNMGKIILSEQRWGRPPCWRSLSNVGDLSLFNLVRRWEGWMCLTERILEVSHKGEKKKD